MSTRGQPIEAASASASDQQTPPTSNATIPTGKFKCHQCIFRCETSSQLKGHVKDYHIDEVVIGTKRFRRQNNGRFTCPGCHKEFGTVSNFGKAHSKCVQALPEELQDEEAFQQASRKFFEEIGIYDSPDGKCLICKEHARILGKQ